MVAEEINEVVDKLAEKVGMAAEAVWPVVMMLIAEVRMLGAAYCAIGILAVVGTGLCVRWIVAVTRRPSASSVKGVAADGDIAAVIMAVILGFVLAVAGFAWLGNGLPRLAAPLAFLLNLA